MLRLRRVGFAAAWLLIAIAIALGGAGIVAQWSHPPGTSGRAELTWAADREVAPRLDGAYADLEAISGQVDRLGVLARGALGALTADDRTPFLDALAEGRETSLAIQRASADLRAELEGMPGADAADLIAYSADSVARRSSMLSALEATGSLGLDWARLTSGAVMASDLILLLNSHDLTVAAAAADGRGAQYQAALDTLARATAMLDDATDIRDQLENTSDVELLDTWLARNRRYDTALTALYTALRDSGGIVNDAVRAAYQEESAARELLPPDTRGLAIIVADIGRGGLNQAVIAIEEARGRLNLALQALAPAEDGAS
jgi:hypothetical protein